MESTVARSPSTSSKRWASATSVRGHQVSAADTLTQGIVGSGFVPESASPEELAEAIRKLREANELKSLENVALREYLLRRRPGELKNLDEKFADLVRRSMYLFRRPPSQIAELAPIQSGSMQSVTVSIQSEAVSVSSAASTGSIASVSALEAKERLPTAEKVTIVRITTQILRERLLRVRSRNEQRLKRLRITTEVAEAQVDDAKDILRAYEGLLVAGVGGHLTHETLMYHVQRLLRDKDQDLQLMSMESGRMRREAADLLQTYARRRELVKELHRVDWDQQRVVNETRQRGIDEKTAHWIAARKTVGYIGLDVHDLQRKVARERARGRWMLATVDYKMKTAKYVLSELPHVRKQAEDEAKRVRRKKELLEKYEPPPLMDYVRDCAARARVDRDLEFYRRNLPIRKVMLQNLCRQLVRVHKAWHEARFGPKGPYKVPPEIRELMKQAAGDTKSAEDVQLSPEPSHTTNGRQMDAGSPLGSWHSLSRSERALLAAAMNADADADTAAAAAAPTHWSTSAAVATLAERRSLLQALHRAHPDAPERRGSQAKAPTRQRPTETDPGAALRASMSITPLRTLSKVASSVRFVRQGTTTA